MSAPTEAATSASSITLKWSKPKSGCTGYWIYQYKNGAWTWIKTISNPSTLQYEVPKLSAATTYSFKIKPYKRVNRRNLAPGLSSGFVATTRPTGVKLASLSTKRAKSIISEFAHIKHIRTHRAKAAHATVLGAVKRQSPSNNLCRAQKTLDMPCPKWYYSKNIFIY